MVDGLCFSSITGQLFGAHFPLRRGIGPPLAPPHLDYAHQCQSRILRTGRLARVHAGAHQIYTKAGPSRQASYALCEGTEINGSP